MNLRVVVAGVFAGLTVFLWSTLSHTALPLGEAGISPLPDQENLLRTLGGAASGRRLHVFPWYEDPAKMTEAMRTSPRGLLALSPASEPFSMGTALAKEAVSDVVGGLFLAFLLAASGAALGGWVHRVAFGAALGAFASTAIDFSYATWYGFPTTYLAAQLTDQVVGWALAALVAGWWLARRR
ncbi:MAG: hypothetical protein F9K18_04975 [Thermoanaerobaculia bacterium]|nr:MAG: hypothetical protein F9K18_04975 [Thermoanaerobaculia bacterium]